MGFARRNSLFLVGVAISLFSLAAEVTPAAALDNLRQWSNAVANLILSIKEIMETRGLTLIAVVLLGVSLWQLWKDWKKSREVESLVNPRYDRDMAALDGKWLLNAVINNETVLIATADTVMGELLGPNQATLETCWSAAG